MRRLWIILNRPDRIGQGPAAVALLLLVIVTYLPALGNGFVFDDHLYVTGNEKVTSADGLSRIWTEVGGPNYTHQYYPLTSTLFWAEHQLWGLEPAGYHAVNILLHALNALLLWRLLRKLKVPGGWVAAAIFGIHPINVQSVAWVAELKNVLSTAFFLGAALALAKPLRLHDEEEPTGRMTTWRDTMHYALGLALFAAALLSKTATGILPVGLLLVIWWKHGRVSARYIALLLPLFVLGAAMVALTVTLEATHSPGGETAGTSMLERVLIAGRSIWFYAGKIIWPVDLMLVYPRWVVDVGSARWSLPLVAVLSVVVLLWQKRREWGRGPLVAVAYFIIAIAPVSLVTVAFAEFTFVADHWQYWAGMALIALGVATIERMSTALRGSPAVRTVLSVIVLSVLGLLSVGRIAVFNRPLTLWWDNAERNPGAWVTWYNLGVALSDEDRPADAKASYERALVLNPRASRARTNFASLLMAEGKPDEAAWHLRLTLRHEPTHVGALYNLALAESRRGRCDLAVEIYRDDLILDPQHAAAAMNLGTVLQELGFLEAAVELYKDALEIRPDSVLTHLNMATVYMELGNRTLAGQHMVAARLLDEQISELLTLGGPR